MGRNGEVFAFLRGYSCSAEHIQHSHIDHTFIFTHMQHTYLDDMAGILAMCF